MNKNEIIDGLHAGITRAKDIVECIENGLATFDEIRRDAHGKFSFKLQEEVKVIFVRKEEEVWQKVKNSNSITQLTNYLQVYQDGMHRQEARDLIDEIKNRDTYQKEDAIWDNIDKHNVQSLQTFIRDNANNRHKEEAKEILDNLLWKLVDKKDINSIKDFANKYPNNPNVVEAKKLIGKLSKDKFVTHGQDSLIENIKNIEADSTIGDKFTMQFEIIKNFLDREEITKKDLLNIIANDHNILHYKVIKSLIENDCIGYGDLSNIGIDERFIRCLITPPKKNSLQYIGNYNFIKEIHKIPSTEVYFWGIPASGKTCVVGSILSTAYRGSDIIYTVNYDQDSQGYNYANRLSSMFSKNGEVFSLPDGTQTANIYEMGMDFISKDKCDNDVITPLTFIDLSGELFRTMYRIKATPDSVDKGDQNALNILDNILNGNRTRNRKMHFFILEYGAEKREYEGLAQERYLDAALTYIDNMKIFYKDTNAVSLIITKVDKAKNMNDIKDFIEKNYRSFYNGLQTKCKKYEIQDGHVDIIPFSLGEVCFQEYCLFDDKYAKKIINEIKKYAPSFKTGIIGTIKERLGK